MDYLLISQKPATDGRNKGIYPTLWQPLWTRNTILSKDYLSNPINNDGKSLKNEVQKYLIKAHKRYTRSLKLPNKKSRTILKISATALAIAQTISVFILQNCVKITN